MTKEETKQLSIEKINIAIGILQCKKEKVTNKRISELSGLSEITVKRYRTKNVSDDSKKVSDKIAYVSHKIKNVSPELKNVSHKSKTSDTIPSKEKPFLIPSPKYSDDYNRFLLRCIKDPNIPSAKVDSLQLEIV